MMRGKLSQNLILCTQFKGFCNKSDVVENGIGNENNNGKSISKTIPDPPTNCCMSGCPNCVWLDYADSLTEYFKDGGKSAIVEMEKTMTDPMMKAFLMHELRMRKK